MQHIPLAHQLRPKSLSEFLGQNHLVAKGKPIARMIEQGKLRSMVFWGPPGVGKTSLAQVIAHETQLEITVLSGVNCGVKDIKAIVAPGTSTILFLDEIHRLNKSQQDVLLPLVESGQCILIGATTENPSFELNRALLSRLQVFVFKPLSEDDLKQLCRKVESARLSDKAIEVLVNAVSGDARMLLNLLEAVLNLPGVLDHQTVQKALPDIMAHFDKKGDLFFDQISALHKSIRGSDVDASLYWFARMIKGGVDPEYIARRLLRAASEDIGNADPRALELCLNAWQTFERLGAPEGELALAQAVVYLALAPKSNAVYMAYKGVLRSLNRHSAHPVPNHLRNAPTKLMKSLGMGKNYQYAHDFPQGYVPNEQYFPDGMTSERYYHPVERGLEVRLREKMNNLSQLDAIKSSDKDQVDS